MDFQSLFGGLGAPNLNGPALRDDLVDTSESIYISSLALLKMLKHGRSGIPFEVMGLMLGDFVDDYIIRVEDVFAMPQTGTSTNVEAIDNVYQTDMIEMLKQLGNERIVVGWYHSHPGFGPWLSGIDMNTQQSFESLNPRSVAVVVDPVQSVKGKVVIDAFRLISKQKMMSREPPRQTTSHVGDLQPPSMVALVHGLDKYYYSMPIRYRKNEFELKMLLNLGKRDWTDSLVLQDFGTSLNDSRSRLDGLSGLLKNYNDELASEKKEKEENPEEKKQEAPKKQEVEEITKSKKEEERQKDVLKRQSKLNEKIVNVGKMDPRRHLREGVEKLMVSNISQTLKTYVMSDLF